MKKICVILTALFGSMALSATAAPLTENKAALPQQCTQLFKETENLIAQAEKQPGTHTQVGEERDTIEDVLEPYLIQQGFLQRTPRGRIATSLTYRHFGLQKPSE